MNEQQFCSSCGKPTPADASFCPACGSRLHAPRSTGPTQDTRLEQPARTTSVFVLGLLSILTLAPLGIVGWILSGKGTQQIKSGRAKPNSLFTAGKVMSIIGTTVTGLAIIISGIIFITSFLQRRTLYTTPATETSLPIYPTNATPSVSVPVQEAPDLARVSIDGTWVIDREGMYGLSAVTVCLRIIGYSNGDLNITNVTPTRDRYLGSWSITGQRQGERILITMTHTVNDTVNDTKLDEGHYELKLVSPTKLIGSLEFMSTGYKVNVVGVKRE